MALVSRGMSPTTYQELSEYRNVFSCLICLDFFSNPRVLDCHHIFCEDCLESYIYVFTSATSLEQKGVVLQCPTCRQTTTSLAGGPIPLDKTTDNVLLSRRKLSRPADAARCDPCLMRDRQQLADFFCHKCVVNMCRGCRSAHDQHHLFVGHVVIHASNKETLDLHCDRHCKMPSVYFCLDCNMPACVVCILHGHLAHQTSKLRDALSLRRDHLKTLLNQFGPRLDKVEAKVRKLNSICECPPVANNRTKTSPPKVDGRRDGGGGRGGKRVDVKADDNQVLKLPEYEKFPRGSNSLSILGWRLVRSASSPTNHITRPGANQNDKLRPEFEQRSETLAKFRDWYIEERSSDSGSNCSRDSLMPYSSNSEVDVSEVDGGANATIERGCSPAVSKIEDEDDRVRMESLQDPGYTTRRQLCDVTPEKLAALLEHIRRHRKLFNLSTKILEMSQSKKLLAIYEDIVDRIQTVLDVEMQFIQTTLDERIALEVIRKRNSSSGSELSSREFRKISSAATFHLDSDGSQVSMLVRPKLLWKMEKQRSDITEMWNPCDVAFLSDETTIVAEYDNLSERNNKLQIFDRSGRPLFAIAQGQIQPLGVAVTREGHIAVTDCKGKRIKILTTSGQTVAEIGKGQFGWPYGIAVNSRGQLVVTDAFNDTVSIYQVDGKRIKVFGSTGSQNSQFRNPYHVTVNASDDIIVSDSGNNCIKVFDAAGNFRFSASEAMRKSSVDVIGERVAKRRKLRGPRGITVDLKGNILVADDCCRVCMFDSHGRYVRNLLTEEESVKFPEAVHCSRGGLLAVTEWNPSSMFAVKVFNLYE